MPSIMDSQVKKCVEYAKRAGWQYHESGSKGVLTPNDPSLRPFTFNLAVSGRGIQNVQSELRRLGVDIPRNVQKPKVRDDVTPQESTVPTLAGKQEPLIDMAAVPASVTSAPKETPVVTTAPTRPVPTPPQTRPLPTTGQDQRAGSPSKVTVTTEPLDLAVAAIVTDISDLVGQLATMVGNGQSASQKEEMEALTQLAAEQEQAHLASMKAANEMITEYQQKLMAITEAFKLNSWEVLPAIAKAIGLS